MLGLAGAGWLPKVNGLLAGAFPALNELDIGGPDVLPNEDGPDVLPNENMLPPGAACDVDVPNGLTEL